MERESHPVAVASVTLAIGAFVVWLVRPFLSDAVLMALAVAGGVVGAAMVVTRSVRTGGVIRGLAVIVVVAGFVRAAMSFEGRLEGGFAVMGGFLVGLSLTQFLLRRFEHPWVLSEKNGS